MSPLLLDSLEKALRQLKSGLDTAALDPGNELMRDGVIKRFEYSIDLCWKLLHRHLRDIMALDETKIRTKKDIFREGARLGLIESAERWLEYYESRNLYSEDHEAQNVYRVIPTFYDDAVQLMEALKRG